MVFCYGSLNRLMELPYEIKSFFSETVLESPRVLGVRFNKYMYNDRIFPVMNTLYTHARMHTILLGHPLSHIFLLLFLQSTAYS